MLLKKVRPLRPLIFFLLAFPVIASAQQTIQIKGKLIDPQDHPIPDAHIQLKVGGEGVITGKGTTTGEDGSFLLKVVAEPTDSLVVSSVGYQTRTLSLAVLVGEDPAVIRLKEEVQKIDRIEVRGAWHHDRSLIRIDKKDFEQLPTPSGQVEGIIKKMPGVSSRNELSSQYSVRGGNYDENLVYVNGIQVYRPLSVRHGKHEGLSFINSDMVSSIRFSAGGFQAQYGDRMSSVLDIRYEQPRDFAADLEMSLLGGSVHLQDTVGKRFTYNTGFRYKSTSYLLNTLDVEGDYDPSFYDLQTYLTYRLAKNTRLEFLGNYNMNRYRFIPTSRETSFGTISNALSMNVYYEGQEKDIFENYMGALTLRWDPRPQTSLRWTASAYRTLESENYDILGEYYLNELDRSINSQTYGDSIMNIGVGGYLEHARNQLQGRIYTLSHSGSHRQGSHLFRWGLRYKREDLRDRTNEWKYVDSAGYSIPYSDESVELYYSQNADHDILSGRLNAYFQDTYRYRSAMGSWFLHGGVRVSHWNFNDQWLISPRASLAFEPARQQDLRLHLSGGYYYQVPVYKEMKRPDGSLNRDIEAQQSVHVVLGAEYDFMAWGRPFKYQAEAYYKDLDHLIPYKIDNVRINYAGDNMAKGYAAGLDMKVNGEFVPGVQSWASLSFLQTMADIQGDSYVNGRGRRVQPGYYPRPTDQLVNFSLFFQDYVPNHPSWKMQLNLHYGSRLPFSPPHTQRYDQVYRMPPYRRVDLGFSKLIRGSGKSYSESHLLHYINSLWVGVEIFNLLDIKNTISYQWIQTVGNQQGQSGQYAVPNYLTSRRINLKLVMKL